MPSIVPPDGVADLSEWHQLARLRDHLEPLCPCPTAAEDERSQEPGPRQECPIHGDGKTFVDYVQRLENLAMSARDLRAQNVYALNPERPVWRRFADAVNALDGA